MELNFDEIDKSGLVKRHTFGMAVYKRDYVPLGESRLISRDGMVLEKFDLKEACG
jgi:hypothetical protein